MREFFNVCTWSKKKKKKKVSKGETVKIQEETNINDTKPGRHKWPPG